MVALRTVAGGSPVLTYYSHTKRTATEVVEDDQFAIDRRVFSNLHVEDFFAPTLPAHLVLHPVASGVEGRSAEHLFQANKRVKLCDAVLLLQVQDPKIVANLARGHFPMSCAFRAYFDLAADEPVVFDEVDITQCPETLQGHAKRRLKNVLKNLAEFYDKKSDELLRARPETHVYVCRPEMRPDWPQIAKEVMFHLNVAKFMGQSPQHKARQSMLDCVKHGVVHFAEHTDNDSIYGDNGDGSGSNQLGKIHNAVAGAISDGLVPGWTGELASSMDRPARDFYRYGELPSTSK